MAGYNVDENLTPVLLTAMHTCFMSHLLGLVLVLVSRELVLVSVLVLLQLVVTTTLSVSQFSIRECSAPGRSFHTDSLLPAASNTHTAQLYTARQKKGTVTVIPTTQEDAVLGSRKNTVREEYNSESTRFALFNVP